MAEKMIHFNDINICTESFGDIHNPTVLLIMGASASMIWWEKDFCQRLSDEGLHVIRYDNRDVGKSVSYEEGYPQYTFEDLADDAIYVLDAYKIKKAHIAGMSMGGIITQIIALRHPERILTISLMMTSNFDPSLPKKDSKVTEAFAKYNLKNWHDKREVLAYVVNRSKILAGSKHPFDETKIRKLAGEDFNRADNLPSMENHRFVKGGTSYLSRTHEINVPTLVIHGTEDPIIPYEHGVYLSKVIPKAALVTLEGTGHEIHYGDWDEIIRAVLKHTAAL